MIEFLICLRAPSKAAGRTVLDFRKNEKYKLHKDIIDGNGGFRGVRGLL